MNLNFDYNSTRSRLILAEYGRNVQNMVDYICELPTKEERNRYAQVVIEMMGFLNPHLRDVADFKHKLWDHLHIISDFKIDVDSPYPVPDRDAIHPQPDQLEYPQHRIRYKHYGYTAERMINKAKQLEDSERKSIMAEGIANFMKMAYVTWNKDSVTDDHILQDLAELSGGELKVRDGFVLTKLDFKTPPPGSRVKGGSSFSGQQQNAGAGKRKKKRIQHSNGGKRH